MPVPLYITVQCEKICRQIVMAGGFATCEMFNCFSVSKTEFLVSISVMRTSPLLTTVTEFYMCFCVSTWLVVCLEWHLYRKNLAHTIPKSFHRTCGAIENGLIRQMNCGLVAEWAGNQTCNQQVAGSSPGRRAAECNPGQVVYTRASVTK